MPSTCTCAKHLTLSCMMPSELERRGFGGSADEEAGWSHSKSCGQCFSVQVETSSIAQGLVLGLELLNIQVCDMDSGIQCTLKGSN